MDNLIKIILISDCWVNIAGNLLKILLKPFQRLKYSYQDFAFSFMLFIQLFIHCMSAYCPNSDNVFWKWMQIVRIFQS